MIYEYDASTDLLTCRGVYHEDEIEGYDSLGVAESVDDALGDLSLLTAPAPFVEQTSDPQIGDGAREVLERWGEKTCLNAPLTYRGEPLGFLMLAWTDREHFLTDDELKLAGGLADQAAAAIVNRRLPAAAAASDGGAPTT